MDPVTKLGCGLISFGCLFTIGMMVLAVVAGSLYMVLGHAAASAVLVGFGGIALYAIGRAIWLRRQPQ